MPNSKPWPKSESEFVISDKMTFVQIAQHALTCGNVNCLVTRMAHDHNTAVLTCVELRNVAERYYEAAGFRQ